MVTLQVLSCAAFIGLLILLLLPLYPVITISFEAGIVVGLLLHSSHTAYSSSAERFKLVE